MYPGKGTVVLIRPAQTFYERIKFEATIEIIEIDIPEGYAIGGQSAEFGTKLGELTITLATDNQLDPGREVTILADLTADVEPNTWKLVVDFATNSAGVPVGPGALRTTAIDVVPPTRDRPGKLTFTRDAGDASEVNESSAVLELVIFGTAEDGSAVITNPSVSGVYRWLAKVHTTADVEDFFEIAPGDQVVIIKAGPTPTSAPTRTPTPVVPTATPSPTSTPVPQDLEPPTLLGISVSPPSIEFAPAPVDLTFTADIIDDLSGVDEWTVVYSSPSGDESIEATAFPGLTQGNPANGLFEATATLPPFSEPGTWEASFLTITDLAGRTRVVSPPVPGAIPGTEGFVVASPEFEALGSELNLSDDDSALVTLPFQFPFLGRTYPAVFVNSNGNLTFGDPNTAFAEDRSVFVTGFLPTIAPFWDDLNPGVVIDGEIGLGEVDLYQLFRGGQTYDNS